jgi:hypothetical protein
MQKNFLLLNSFWLASSRSMTKLAGSESGSGSTPKCHGIVTLVYRIPTTAVEIDYYKRFLDKLLRFREIFDERQKLTFQSTVPYSFKLEAFFNKISIP